MTEHETQTGGSTPGERLADLIGAKGRERAVLLSAPYSDESHLTRFRSLLSEWLARHSGSATTRATYTTDIRHYLLWCARVGVNPLAVHQFPQPRDVGPATFQAYEMHLRAADDAPTKTGRWSARTIQRKISVTSSMYNYAETTGYLPRDPRGDYAFGSPTPAIPHLTPAHLHRLDHAARNPPRNAATPTRGPLVLELLKIDARPGQILALTGADLDLTGEKPAARLPRAPRSDGTTPPPDHAQLPPSAVAAILAHYAAVGVPGPRDPVVANRDGTRMTRRRLTAYTGYLCRLAGIPPTGPDPIRLAYDYHAKHTPTP